MASITYLNGVAVQTGGYWSDRHCHMVLVCEGQLLTSCTSYPYENTLWHLITPLACLHNHSRMGPKS